MVQINADVIHSQQFLNGHFLKQTFHFRTKVIPIMVAYYQMDFPMQSVQNALPIRLTAQTEVSKMVYRVMTAYHLIPIVHQHILHLLHILKRALAHLNYPTMAEMGV